MQAIWMAISWMPRNKEGYVPMTNKEKLKKTEKTSEDYQLSKRIKDSIQLQKMLEEICKHGANTEDKKVCMKKGEIRKYASRKKRKKCPDQTAREQNDLQFICM